MSDSDHFLTICCRMYDRLNNVSDQCIVLELHKKDLQLRVQFMIIYGNPLVLYGPHLEFIWDSPYGTHMDPCCIPHMGPLWAAHMGPI